MMEIMHVVRISQMLRVAGFDARVMEVIIALLKMIGRDRDIYKLKSCTLSLTVKGLCALYTNL